MEDLDAFPYSGHAAIVRTREFASQDVEAVLARFSSDARDARRLYREFVAAGFASGTREQFRGGGLVRSAGGLEAVLSEKSEEREVSDPRVLGSGEFVEELWNRAGERKGRTLGDLEEILTEVAQSTGVARKEILGRSQARRPTAARRLFYLRAQEETGASASLLGRWSGRTHVAVTRAVEKARRSRSRGTVQG